jgi:hypothetical protein
VLDDRTSNVYKLVALIILSAILLLAACGAEGTPIPTPTEVASTATPTEEVIRTTASTPTLIPQESNVCAPGSAPEFITQVVLAEETEGENFTPVGVTDRFTPEQSTFHAVVTLENAPANTSLRAVWYLLRAEGYTPNTKIDETELTVAAGGSRNVEFTLENTQDVWPPGSYCIEVYAEGDLALSKPFSVTGTTTPSTAGAEVVRQVVMAEGTQPGSFEPVNPTITFQKDAEFIHAVIQVEDAPPNSVFRARWYPPNQDPLDFELTTGGTRWLDFRLTPSPDGFPTGDYQVEIYVNDNLADTKTFRVE